MKSDQYLQGLSGHINASYGTLLYEEDLHDFVCGGGEILDNETIAASSMVWQAVKIPALERMKGAILNLKARTGISDDTSFILGNNRNEDGVVLVPYNKSVPERFIVLASELVQKGKYLSPLETRLASFPISFASSMSKKPTDYSTFVAHCPLTLRTRKSTDEVLHLLSTGRKLVDTLDDSVYLSR